MRGFDTTTSRVHVLYYYSGYFWRGIMSAKNEFANKRNSVRLRMSPVGTGCVLRKFDLWIISVIEL